jgi:hypothetical protein
MSTAVPFEDGHRFVIGVRILILAVTAFSGIAGAVVSTFHLQDGTDVLPSTLVFFSVRAAIIGYLAGIIGAIFAIVASRWSRWTSGIGTIIGVAAPFVVVDRIFTIPDDFLGLMPPLWVSLIMALLSGVAVSLLPHPTLHIEWATIIGRNKYMLFAQEIDVDVTPQMAELSKRLDEWDPIGVYDFMTADQWPSGEYDDLVMPILDVLQAGVRPHELARELVAVFKHDYGIEVSIRDADPIAGSLVEWYAAESVSV